MRTWWPPAFQAIGIRGVYRGGFTPFTPPAVAPTTVAWSTLFTVARGPRRKEAAGTPSPLFGSSLEEKTTRGKERAIFCRMKAKNFGVVSLRNEERWKSYPPKGGICEKERGRKNEITQYRERETGGTHHQGASLGEKRGCCRWRSERKRPRRKRPSRRH